MKKGGGVRVLINTTKNLRYGVLYTAHHVILVAAIRILIIKIHEVVLSMSNKNNYCVYAHIFPNKKVYIGMTGQEPKKRWNDGYGYIANTLMFDDIVKYGWSNIEHRILYKGLTKERALELEMYTIVQLRTTDERRGYNQLRGCNTSFRNRMKKIVQHNKRVMCINNRTVFDNIKQASMYGNTTMLDIDNCCNGYIKTAGTNKKGEKLLWKYI